MRLAVSGVSSFITLQLESCSKFLAVFATFCDSPLFESVLKKHLLVLVQSILRWTNAVGNVGAITMNEKSDIEKI